MAREYEGRLMRKGRKDQEKAIQPVIQDLVEHWASYGVMHARPMFQMSCPTWLEYARKHLKQAEECMVLHRRTGLAWDANAGRRRRVFQADDVTSSDQVLVAELQDRCGDGGARGIPTPPR
nr:hypothetical protein CFP56_09321 [Quercus suber]